MSEKFSPLEKYFRDLPVSQEEVTLTLARIEEILHEPLPPQAWQDHTWWENQRQGLQVETIAWMDAGWMVEIVNLNEKWVRFVRQ